jgi:hypothetical protein
MGDPTLEIAHWPFQGHSWYNGGQSRADAATADYDPPEAFKKTIYEIRRMRRAPLRMKHKTNAPYGQALIVLAFAFIVLAAFAGLAIDGGRLYAERRQVQNAADAAATAGAMQLAGFIADCDAGNTPNDNTVAAAVADLAMYNGVDHFSPDGDVEAWYVDAEGKYLGRVGWNLGIPNSATGIKTTLTLTETATFMRMVGQPALVASAEAVAMVGPVTQIGGGVLPIAVPERVIAEFRNDEEFIVTEDGLFCYAGDPESCVLPPADKGITDTEKMSTDAFYGWLNFSHVYNNAYWNGGAMDRAFGKGFGSSGCKYKPNGTVDAAKTGLNGWLSKKCPYPYPLLAGESGEIEGDFIHGFTGTRTSALHELAANYSKGDVLYWLIYDKTLSPKEMEKTFPGQAPSVGWMTAGGGKNRASYYHIIGFVAVEFLGVDAKGEDKWIMGTFQNTIIGEGLIDPGPGLGSGGMGTCQLPTLIGVKLWK